MEGLTFKKNGTKKIAKHEGKYKDGVDKNWNNFYLG